MKKGDIVIFLLVIALIIVSAAALFVFKDGTDGTVIIRQNNEEVYEASLDTDNTVELEGNTIKIKDGEVFMDYADCANQSCVKSKAVRKAGESIICLPNKVIVEIK